MAPSPLYGPVLKEKFDRRPRRSTTISHVPIKPTDPEIAEADERYLEVAKDAALRDFFATKEQPSRAPYASGEVMCRGAQFYPKWKAFLEQGGVGKFKNAVVTSIRVNSLLELDEMSGSFRVDFFLDLAFWVPRFNLDFYNDDETVGVHTR
jgi:hypothetical protein